MSQRRRRIDFYTGNIISAPTNPDLSGTATSTAPTDYVVSNSILNTALNTVKVQGDVTATNLTDYEVFT